MLQRAPYPFTDSSEAVSRASGASVGASSSGMRDAAHHQQGVFALQPVAYPCPPSSVVQRRLLARPLCCPRL